MQSNKQSKRHRKHRNHNQIFISFQKMWNFRTLDFKRKITKNLTQHNHIYVKEISTRKSLIMTKNAERKKCTKNINWYLWKWNYKIPKIRKFPVASLLGEEEEEKMLPCISILVKNQMKRKFHYFWHQINSKMSPY